MTVGYVNNSKEKHAGLGDWFFREGQQVAALVQSSASQKQEKPVQEFVGAGTSPVRGSQRISECISG